MLIGQSGLISTLLHFFYRCAVKKVEYSADWVRSEYSLTVATESSNLNLDIRTALSFLKSYSVPHTTLRTAESHYSSK